MMDEYYVNTGDSTTYWFATGHKPTLACKLAEVSRRQHKHRTDIPTELILKKARECCRAREERLK